MAKIEFEMSQEQLDKLLNACKPVLCIALNCGPISSPQENANRAWRSLGEEMGFVWDTVEPVRGRPNTVFRAEPIQKQAEAQHEPD